MARASSPGRQRVHGDVGVDAPEVHRDAEQRPVTPHGPAEEAHGLVDERRRPGPATRSIVYSTLLVRGRGRQALRSSGARSTARGDDHEVVAPARDRGPLVRRPLPPARLTPPAHASGHGSMARPERPGRGRRASGPRSSRTRPARSVQEMEPAEALGNGDGVPGEARPPGRAAHGREQPARSRQGLADLGDGLPPVPWFGAARTPSRPRRTGPAAQRLARAEGSTGCRAPPQRAAGRSRRPGQRRRRRSRPQRVWSRRTR